MEKQISKVLRVWLPILNTAEFETELQDINSAVRSGFTSDRTGDHLRLALLMGAEFPDVVPFGGHAA
jgi:hypothetical protein